VHALEPYSGQEQQDEQQSPPTIRVVVAAPGVVRLQILG
jgi:hypothetical protein